MSVSLGQRPPFVPGMRDAGCIVRGGEPLPGVPMRTERIQEAAAATAG
jgi:hypothetical protein